MAEQNDGILRLKDFQKAMGDSPHVGIGYLKNVDIESYPGAMRAQKLMLSLIQSLTQRTFTADAPTNVCTASGDIRTQAEIDKGNNAYYAPVYLTSTGTLPAGLSTGTVYFVIYVSSTTFKLASSWANADAGTEINITDAGTGTHTINPVPIGTFRHIIKDPRDSYYFGSDSNGRIWNTRGGSEFYLLLNSALDNGSSALTQGEGQGISLFRNSDGTATYLFVFRNALVDVINVFGNTQLNTPTWTNGWQSMNSGAGSGNPHKAIVGQDNITYFCDDRYVGSIKENAGSVFDPANAATYTYNNQALDMPQGEITDWLEELGVNLLIAGQQYDKIYPWDRTSDSYNLPLTVPEKGVFRLKNLGSTIYILAGTRGNIYTTQGTYVKFFVKIPEHITNPNGSLLANPVAWGGIAAREGALLVGVGYTVSGGGGVWMIYPDGRFLQDNTPYGGSKKPEAIFAESAFYYIGYQGGADYTDTHRQTNGFLGSTYQSPFFRVGNKTQKAKYSEFELQLATPGTNGSFRFKYRTSLTGTFVDPDAGQVAMSCDGSTTSMSADIGLIDLENIQVQLQFDGDMDIMEARLIP